jgi:hypothetical protein
VPAPPKLPPPLPPPPRPVPPSQRAKSSAVPPPPSQRSREQSQDTSRPRLATDVPAAAPAPIEVRREAGGSAADLAPEPAPAVAPAAAAAVQRPIAPVQFAETTGVLPEPPAVRPAGNRVCAEPEFEMVRGVLTVRQVLATRIAVGRGALPLWSALAAVAALAVIAAGLLAALGSGSESGAVETGAAAAASQPSATSSVRGSAADTVAAGSLAKRATVGEQAALEALRERPPGERSADETIAVAQGRVAQQIGELRQLHERLQRDRALSTDPHSIETLLKLTQDPRTASEALRVVADLRSPTGPDLLFHIWTATPERTDTTRLGEELLFSKDVRPRASPALSVVLDLRDTQDCQQVRGVVARAEQHADRRALVALRRLQRRGGCGPRQTEDCYPCLRGGPEVERALAAAASRDAPAF